MLDAPGAPAAPAPTVYPLLLAQERSNLKRSASSSSNIERVPRPSKRRGASSAYAEERKEHVGPYLLLNLKTIPKYSAFKVAKGCQHQPLELKEHWQFAFDFVEAYTNKFTNIVKVGFFPFASCCLTDSRVYRPTTIQSSPLALGRSPRRTVSSRLIATIPGSPMLSLA